MIDVSAALKFLNQLPPSIAIVIGCGAIWYSSNQTFITKVHAESIHTEIILTSEASMLEMRIDVLDERIYRALKRGEPKADIERLKSSKNKLEDRKNLIDGIQYEKYRKTVKNT